MNQVTGWTRQQLLVALYVYCRTPFGKLHSKNPEIVGLAEYIGRSASALAMKCCNFASLDPRITENGRKGLKGASNADRAIWREANQDWSLLLEESIEVIDTFNVNQMDDFGVKDFESTNYSSEDHFVIAKARKGQQLFRQTVLTSYGNQCCITGLKEPKLIVASHIIPWQKDKTQRLNPHNGLALNTLHDKAFDLGLITVNDDMTVRVSNRLKQHDEFTQKAIVKFHGQGLILPERFMPNTEFLQFHRDNVFALN
jgi:putative restriction endonuclease